MGKNTIAPGEGEKKQEEDNNVESTTAPASADPISSPIPRLSARERKKKRQEEKCERSLDILQYSSFTEAYPSSEG